MGLPSLEWIAGFFDGEGCICTCPARRGARSRVLDVSISQAYPAPLEDIKQIFGGYLHALHPAIGHRKTVYNWKVQAKKAEAFLRAIQPFVRVKHKQIELALKMRDLINIPQLDKTEDTYNEVIELCKEISLCNGANYKKESLVASLEVR